jgi:hypothetical protein
MRTAINFKTLSQSRLVGVVAAASLLLFVILPVLVLASFCVLAYLAIQTLRYASASSVQRRSP